MSPPLRYYSQPAAIKSPLRPLHLRRHRLAPRPPATLTATPSSVAPGQKVTLNWKTTDATDVSIDGIGPVETAGVKTVTPTQSTDYHLVARGPGGSTDATARVTVGAESTMADMSGGDTSVDDATFHTNVVDVFFDYDAYDVRPDAQSVITKDVQFPVRTSKAEDRNRWLLR